VLQKLENLSTQVEELRRSVTVLRNQSAGNAQAASILPLNPIHGIEVVPRREVVLGEGNSLSVADRLLLNKDAKKALEAEEMGASRDDEYPLGEDDEDDADNDIYRSPPPNRGEPMIEEETRSENAMEEEAEEAEAEEEEAEAEEEEAEEEEAEADAEELEAFEYKGNTFYRDSENNVFMTDEDGDLVEEPIGTWNVERNKIIMKASSK
jgi:cobalamin biosynthesis protein CobT